MITTEPMVLFPSLAAGLWVIISHAQMLGLRHWCLVEISDFSECLKVPTTGTSVFFCHFKAPVLWTVFPYKSKLRNALLHSRSGCLKIETLSSAALLPVTLNTVHEKSLLILYYSQHSLVIVKFILQNNPPPFCLPHTSHKGFQR